MRRMQPGLLTLAVLLTSFFGVPVRHARGQSHSQPQIMPSGQLITPLAPKRAKFSQLNPGLRDFPDYTVGQAM